MPAPQVALRPFCAHVLGGVGNASPQTLFLQRIPQVTERQKIRWGEEGKLMQLGHLIISILDKKKIFFLFQNYWSVEYFLFFLEIAN